MTLTLGWQNHMLATHEAVEEAIARIKRIARSRYLNYQSMIKQWLAERLEKEL